MAVKSPEGKCLDGAEDTTSWSAYPAHTKAWVQTPQHRTETGLMAYTYNSSPLEQKDQKFKVIPATYWTSGQPGLHETPLGYSLAG